MKLIAQKTKKIEVPGDADGGFVVIKNLSLEEVANIEGKYFEVTNKEIRMVNYAEREGEFARACLTDWGNLFDESERPMKFTAKNIDKASQFAIEIDGKQTRFYEWINDEREKFAEEVAEQESAARKN